MVVLCSIFNFVWIKNYGNASGVTLYSGEIYDKTNKGHFIYQLKNLLICC